MTDHELQWKRNQDFYQKSGKSLWSVSTFIIESENPIFELLEKELWDTAREELWDITI